MNLELKVDKKFEEYLYRKHHMLSGIQYMYAFPNGYGASVIKHDGSYGHEDDLWELAVLEFVDERSNLCYTTPIADDVIGWLIDESVNTIMHQIFDLKGENDE